MSRDEMSRQDELNTAAAFHNVRVGGPKEKRIKRVELMGEHTPKPLQYIRVAQTPLAPGNSVLSPKELQDFFEERIGAECVGECYAPLNISKELAGGQLQPWDFFLIGFYKKADQESVGRNIGSNTEYMGVRIECEAVKNWFVDLYPKDPRKKLFLGN